MKAIHNGQCGLCVHFGEAHPDVPELASIHKSQQAPEDFVDDCGHPQHAPLKLKVTPLSGCSGFEAAKA
jgi:hypothetical protein